MFHKDRKYGTEIRTQNGIEKKNRQMIKQQDHFVRNREKCAEVLCNQPLVQLKSEYFFSHEILLLTTGI